MINQKIKISELNSAKREELTNGSLIPISVETLLGNLSVLKTKNVTFANLRETILDEAKRLILEESRLMNDKINKIQSAVDDVGVNDINTIKSQIESLTSSVSKNTNAINGVKQTHEVDKKKLEDAIDAVKLNVTNIKNDLTTVTTTVNEIKNGTVEIPDVDSIKQQLEEHLQEFEDFKEEVRNMQFKPVEPPKPVVTYSPTLAFSITPVRANFGNTISVKLSWRVYMKGSDGSEGATVNDPFATLSVSGGSTVYTSDATRTNYTVENISQTTTFRISGTLKDGGKTLSSSATVTFYASSYFGTVQETFEPTDESVKELIPSLGIAHQYATTKAFTKESALIDDACAIYIYPSSLGALTSIKDEGGQPMLNQYFRYSVTVDGISYYVYRQPVNSSVDETYKLIFS